VLRYQESTKTVNDTTVYFGDAKLSDIRIFGKLMLQTAANKHWVGQKKLCINCVLSLPDKSNNIKITAV